MAVKFFRPTLVVENISQKAVRLLGLTTILPGEKIDLFDQVEQTTIYEDLILKALEKPWGDLYNEVVVKRTLVIHSLALSSFYYGVVTPDNIVSDNSYFPGAVASVVDSDTFSWISPAIASAQHPLEISAGVISIPKASAVSDGYLSKEDWLTFAGNTKPAIKIWQYQDFSAPVSTSISLSNFQNGTGLAFNASYIISDTAEITIASDSSIPPTTTLAFPARYLPSSRVTVSSHIGTTVILSGAPDASLSCRIYFLIELPAGVPLPSGYQEDPEFINDSNLEYLDDNYVNQNQDETIYGVKTFASDTIFSGNVGVNVLSPSANIDVSGLIQTTSLRIPTGASDGYIFTSDATGLGSWEPLPAAGVTDHGFLTGLTDDDHPIYLLVDGARPMSGDLDMDGYSILSSRLDGVLYFRLPSGAYDGYVLTSNGAGEASWMPASAPIYDHGSLTGLDQDDHSQYLILDGSAARNTLTGYLDGYAGRIRIPNVFDPQSDISTPGLGEIAFDTNDGYMVIYTSMGWRTVAAAGSGITEVQHENLDTLVHNLAENFYEEIVTTGGKVTSVIDWSSPSKILKIREFQYSYNGSKIVQEIAIQYDASGVEVQRLTTDFNYIGNAIVSSNTTETP